MIAEPFVSANVFPSAELYSIVEDRQGIKWVASDVGLLKIVGNQVTHLTTRDGLAENVVLRVYSSPTGKLWVTGLRGSLAYIHQNTIKKLPHTPLKQKLQTPIVQLIPFSNDAVLFTQQNAHFTYQATPHTITTLETHADSLITIHLLPEKKALVQMPKVPLFFAPRWIIQTPKQRYDLGKIVKGILSANFRAYIAQDSSLCVYMTNELFKIRDFKILNSYTLPHKILFSKELDGKIYVGVFNNGLYCLDKNSLQKIKIGNLDKLSVTDMMQDQEGNLWFTTLEKGLFVARLPQAKRLYQGENMVLNLKNDQVILSNNTILNAKESRQIRFPSKSVILHTVAVLDNQKIYLTSEGVKFEDKTHFEKLAQFAKDYVQMNDMILVFGAFGLSCIETNKSTKFPTKFRVLCAEKYNERVILLGTQENGIKKIDLRYKRADTSHFAGSYRVNCLKTVAPNMIAVGTNDLGVLLMDSIGKVLQTIPHLPQRIDCLAYQDSTLYIGTRFGLYVYNLPSQKMLKLNHRNFLPFDEIVKLQIVGKELYIAGKYEVIHLPTQDLQKLPIYIQLYYRKTLVGKTLHFDLNQTSYKAAQNIAFYIEILNQDNGKSKRYSTRQTHFETELAYGNFVVKIYAQDSLTNNMSSSQTFRLALPAPYYETNWFWTMCGILFVGLVWWVAFRIVRQVKKQELQKRLIQQKMIDLESQALQAQMNPHFIFNAINSIQAFILQHKTEEAHFYLAEFAKLFRLILKHSQQKEVTLAEEVELLRLYIALEAQRLKDMIDFQLDINNEIETDNTLVPTMLLQPIVENAVWHGLKPDIRPKIIRLRAFEQDACLHLHLYNNGKPIETSALPTLHDSKGLLIVQERIKVLFEKTPDFPTFSLENAPKVGVVAKIVVPLNVLF
ncbi:MAG: histidine kinase [Microscillaceae bacterium]|nr:histidine kinase [Microscillaceae bacterium]